MIGTGAPVASPTQVIVTTGCTAFAQGGSHRWKEYTINNEHWCTALTQGGSLRQNEYPSNNDHWVCGIRSGRLAPLHGHGLIGMCIGFWGCASAFGGGHGLYTSLLKGP
jgi:hypothetical protein